MELICTEQDDDDEQDDNAKDDEQDNAKDIAKDEDFVGNKRKGKDKNGNEAKRTRRS